MGLRSEYLKVFCRNAFASPYDLHLEDTEAVLKEKLFQGLQETAGIVGPSY